MTLKILKLTPRLLLPRLAVFVSLPLLSFIFYICLKNQGRNSFPSLTPETFSRLSSPLSLRAKVSDFCLSVTSLLRTIVRLVYSQVQKTVSPGSLYSFPNNLHNRKTSNPLHTFGLNPLFLSTFSPQVCIICIFSQIPLIIFGLYSMSFLQTFGLNLRKRFRFSPKVCIFLCGFANYCYFCTRQIT